MPLIGPTLPNTSSSNDKSSSAETLSSEVVAATPARKVIGPSLPPAPGSERGTADTGTSSAVQTFLEREERMKRAAQQQQQHDAAQGSSSHDASKRDDWMLSMPSAQSFSDALRNDASLALKGRGFSQAAGKRVQSRSSAAVGPGDDGSLWMETPAEREQRLRDEELGIRARSTTEQPTLGAEQEAALERDRHREAEIARAVQEHNAKRGPSLLDQHQAKRRGAVKERKHNDGDNKSHSRRRQSVSDISSEDLSENERRRKRRDHDRERRGAASESSEADSRHGAYGSSSSKAGARDSNTRGEKRRHISSHRSRRQHDDEASSRSAASEEEEDARKTSRHSSTHHHRSASRERRHRERKERRRREKEERRREKGHRKRYANDNDDPAPSKSKGSAPMMVWDREAAMSVGGRLMGEKQRMDTIRSAAGLKDRFSGGGAAGMGGSRFL